MTLAPIGNLTPPHQAPDADAKTVAEAHKVAKQFEAIFLRQLMGALEKAGGLGSSSKGGAGVLRSMMVTAFADSTAEGGGIGLADVVFKAMLPPSAAAAPPATTAAAPTATAPAAATLTAAAPTAAAAAMTAAMTAARTRAAALAAAAAAPAALTAAAATTSGGS